MKKLAKNWYLKKVWAKAQKILDSDNPYIIAVTGSVGKTTTKDAIVHLLGGPSKNVRGSFGNMNTEYTIPLVIAGQKKVPRGLFDYLKAYLNLMLKSSGGPKGHTLVLEFASEKKGDIAFLAEKIPLDVVVLTQFAVSHAGPTLQAIAQEKLDIIQGLRSDGVLVYNKDDEWQAKLKADKRAISYGEKQAVVTYSNVAQEQYGSSFTVNYQHKSRKVKTQLLGLHQISSLAAAMAVGLSRGKDLSSLVKRAGTFAAPAGRMKLIKGRKEMLIIDDSYNSSPVAALEALKTLSSIAKKGQRKVAILGNMNELGAQTVPAHLALGKQAAEQKVDFLVAVGPNAKRIIRGARESGMEDQRLISFDSVESVISRLDGIVQAKDVILVKASQGGMFFERIVKALMANPQQANELLVRQDYKR